MNDINFDESTSYLKQTNAEGGSIFDHLSELVLQIVESRPNDAFERFEEFSEKLKNKNLDNVTSEYTENGEPIPLNILQKLRTSSQESCKSLFQNEPQQEEQQENEVKSPSAFDEAFYFAKFGVGIGQEELTQILLHMKRFFSKLPLKTIRLFGKFYGLNKNYYVVEGELLSELEEEEGSGEAPEENVENEGQAIEEGGELQEEEGEEAPGEPAIEPDIDEPQTPRPIERKLPEEIPKEERKPLSPNQFVYWACNGPTDNWKRLPDVTPQLIRSSRFVCKMLTGDLNANVSTGYPSFPGKEKHYLRCQIARISHSASVVPRAWAKKVLESAPSASSSTNPSDFGGAGGMGGEEAEEAEEGGEEGEEGAPRNYFGLSFGASEGMGLRKKGEISVDSLKTTSAWCHLRPPILVQGRVEKYPPVGEGGEEGEEEEEGGNGDGSEQKKKKKEMEEILPDPWEGEPDDPRAGTNLELKRCIDDDKGLGAQKPGEKGCNGRVGSFKLRADPASKGAAGCEAVLLESNYWPGAYTLAYGKESCKVSSIYIGWGKKHTIDTYTMPPPPSIPDEYPDVEEMNDPTPEEEAEVAKPKEEAIGEEQHEEGGEEGAEEGDEYENE
ncbi:putative Radial spokehead-like protein 1 [Monocercomonoides exilis]|uniref:putative Radial spokehead-like protein 1 n=1 Tax=Monocercomonoides exilis TaxID=2049356 RepID=UPI0035596719|nr:putative Radial spokehead-like protein 1 [Monocercomonoides exilis]|eukprot:MONOS_13848.1-p1 / transcript=MONOS_13848.1 / gene=MONOS_13848 / organism=Monocercomonoides_exilis_PA203 / gene_product=Radial spokehead-like protein 1 / transcript_product=Radial spokehead-like protein 1 / location=Mono_scaffold00893:7755-10169(+) / protein_length=612 / sequence_SO=supercontig / SO=protein_coding / is_pseudo=false